MITYNRLEFTKLAIEAALQCDELQLFVFDNGSTDGTREYLKSLTDPKIFITVLNGENIGIAGAMNWFINISEDYEFVAKIDNDTLVPKDFVARMLPHMEHADLVQAKHTIIKETNFKGWQGFTVNMKRRNHLLFHHFIGGSGVLMRRSVLSAIPETEWKLYGWREWQRQHPEVIKAFATDVEIRLLDTDDNGANYPKEYEDYYIETGRIKSKSMLTNSKEITTAAYWDRIYAGDNNGAKVDASDTKRTTTFDRFNIVVNHAEGKTILGIGSGHAHIEKRIKGKLPDSIVIASDQAKEAQKVAKYEPYLFIDGYDIPFKDKYFDLVICCQAIEYMEFPQRFLAEAKRVGKNFICTLPKGEMKQWSQLRIYTEENAREFLSMFGEITVFEDYGDLMLFKIRFNE